MHKEVLERVGEQRPQTTKGHRGKHHSPPQGTVIQTETHGTPPAVVIISCPQCGLDNQAVHYTEGIYWFMCEHFQNGEWCETLYSFQGETVSVY